MSHAGIVTNERPGGEAWEGRNPDWLESGVEMRWSFPAHAETVDQLADVGFAVLADTVVADELAEDDDASFPFVLARLA